MCRSNGCLKRKKITLWNQMDVAHMLHSQWNLKNPRHGFDLDDDCFSIHAMDFILMTPASLAQSHGRSGGPEVLLFCSPAWSYYSTSSHHGTHLRRRSSCSTRCTSLNTTSTGSPCRRRFLDHFLIPYGGVIFFYVATKWIVMFWLLILRCCNAKCYDFLMWAHAN